MTSAVHGMAHGMELSCGAGGSGGSDSGESCIAPVEEPPTQHPDVDPTGAAVLGSRAKAVGDAELMMARAGAEVAGGGKGAGRSACWRREAPAGKPMTISWVSTGGPMRAAVTDRLAKVDAGVGAGAGAVAGAGAGAG